jgi:tetrahydromethanopterin S-methyltransferase subunit B
VKPACILFALAAPILCAAQIRIQPVTVPPQSIPASAEISQGDLRAIAKLEAGFEDSIKTLDPKDPFVLLGACSGIYVKGYGVVFTTPLDLISTPRVTPFAQVISKAQADRVRESKIAHLPLLKDALRNSLLEAARTLTSLPENETIVVAARLFYLDWENRTNLPSQIVLRATRQAALAGTIQTDNQ